MWTLTVQKIESFTRRVKRKDFLPKILGTLSIKLVTQLLFMKYFISERNVFASPQFVDKVRCLKA
jgi:hypothetical protein